MKKLMVSGYKTFELGIYDQNHPGIPFIKKAIENKLRQFIDEGLEWVLISGQIGVELWCAEVVYELKKEFSQLKLAVVTPFLEQEKRWKEETQDYYRSIVEKADMYTSTSDQPYVAPWQFQMRDQAALIKTDGILLVYDAEKEGSPKYIKEKAEKYAEKNEYNLHMIDFYEIQLIAEEEQQREMWE